MALIWRTQFEWTGWVGSPGYTALYANANVGTLQGFVNDAYGFMSDALFSSASGAYLPAVVRISQSPVAQTIDDASGDITAQTAVAPGTQINGLGSGNFAASTGACVTWYTNTFINGRRLRGRTFFVPLAGIVFATDGTLGSAYIATVQGAVTQYLGKPSEPVVWHRPTSSGASDGSSALISTGVVTDKAAVLTSRRD